MASLQKLVPRFLCRSVRVYRLLNFDEKGLNNISSIRSPKSLNLVNRAKWQIRSDGVHWAPRLVPRRRPDTNFRNLQIDPDFVLSN